ncbi:MAG: imidazolonepropionase [Planctomycetaceae bacterium]|nr:imidazolonepropionase [Planctomycetaceae bacterium]
MIQRLIQSAAFFAWLSLPVTGLASPEIPGAPQSSPIALVGGTVHPVSGPAIKEGVVLFRRGKITYVGRRRPIPEGTEVIDVSGKHVFPGMCDAFTNLGLVEVNRVRASVDHAETGQLNPNVRAHVAVNPDSELIPVTRSNGVLLVATVPTGGLIAGKAAVLQLDGWTYEDLTLQAEVGLHVNWPSMSPVSDWWVEKPPAARINQTEQALRNLQQAFDDARAYQRARQAAGEQPFDIRWEAMQPVVAGKLPLIVSANELQQIQAAVAFAVRNKVDVIVYGGYDAVHCAALLVAHHVPVIVGNVYRLPRRRDDDYDAPYTLPERLRQAGVKFCISGSGRFGAANVRNLPYHAATAAAYGLPRDEALKAITLSPAQILGIADRVGSLEKGKDATLFVANGDPLLTATKVQIAYVQGRRVQLSDRHKKLWRKYREKYRRVKRAQ